MPGRAALRFAADGWSHVDPALFGDALAHDLPPRLARSLAAAQKPTHAACLTAPAPRGAWHELPCGYVLSAEDRILDPRLQRWFAARAGAVVTELPSSHLSPLSHPGEVAAAISATLERAGVPRTDPRRIRPRSGSRPRATDRGAGRSVRFPLAPRSERS